MIPVIVTRKLTIDGRLADATSMLCVVTNAATGGVVAATTAHPSLGVYTFSVSAPDDALTYHFAITAIYGGETYTNVVTVAEAKAWCRIDHTADDLLICGLIDAAVEAAEGGTGRVLTGDNAETASGLLIVGIKLLIGEYYDNREASTARDLKVLPRGVDNIFQLCAARTQV